jgi:hypothetical protein
MLSILAAAIRRYLFRRRVNAATAREVEMLRAGRVLR